MFELLVDAMMDVMEKLESCLKSHTELNDAEGQLIKSKVKTMALQMDPALITILLSDDILKKAFFKEVNGTLVFDKTEFIWTLDLYRHVEDSYTSFTTQIGLIDEKNNYITKNDDVYLSFPYKDCLLVFDSTDEKADRDEVFLNEVLCKSDIDVLKAKKLLSNANLHDKDGVHAITEYNGENLLIKGNNYLVMNSLLPEYQGAVKCMYWDILYNTDNDKVPYADSFKHSSWLVMMKNRLEVAKQLLSSEGCIFIQCDDNEQAYLKVLCDEVFGRDNFVNCIAVKMSEATGVKMSHADKRFPKLKEYILFYKGSNFKGFYEIDKYPIDQWDNENNIFLENFTKAQREELISISAKEDISDEDTKRALTILKDVKKVSLNKKIKELGISDKNLTEWLFENSFRIIKTCGSASLCKLVEKINIQYDQDIACALSRDKVLFFYITDYNRDTAQPRLRVIFADENIYKNPCDFWQDIKTTGAISNEGGVILTNGKKPEKILHRILKMTTKPGDLVLDAYFGSGTTGAVAMKMGRKFIGIEQLDSHYKMSIERLTNVINGDKRGISEEVGWTGGGSFVSCELKELTQKTITRILEASPEELSTLYDEIINSPFTVNYKVDLEELKKPRVKEEFDKLDVESKKKFLKAIQEKNLLYVNYSDRFDESLCDSQADKTFTESLYGE